MSAANHLDAFQPNRPRMLHEAVPPGFSAGPFVARWIGGPVVFSYAQEPFGKVQPDAILIVPAVGLHSIHGGRKTMPRQRLHRAHTSAVFSWAEGDGLELIARGHPGSVAMAPLYRVKDAAEVA